MRAPLALALTVVVPLVSGCAAGTSFGVAKSLARLEPRDGDHTYKIVASSMEPTLHCARPAPNCRAQVSDRILVRPYGAALPHRGDVVAFRTPPQAFVRCGAGGVFVKRVVGLPGEVVREANGVVYIDGRRLREPYVRERDAEPARSWSVPAGRYFLLGDARAYSCDSRVWGSVPKVRLIGKAIGIYWPQARFRRLQ
jgi:signal peptidase I